MTGPSHYPEKDNFVAICLNGRRLAGSTISMLRTFSILFSFFFVVSAQAQIGLIPLRNNPTLAAYRAEHPTYQWNQSDQHIKWGTDDTLNLPFFEDFTSTLMYPDSTKWRDNYVYVNRDMAINPPSYGVATFDYLDEFGQPYSSIEPTSIDSGDMLTSQAINLADSFGSPYTLADSIVFTFFYQCRGYGDLITSDDSLRLEFLDKNGNWNLMWSAGGNQNLDFQHVLVLIDNANYLHAAFQFRFRTMTHRWGNNNLWHVDFIYLNSGRSVNDRYYDDYSIQSPPSSLLKRYSSMPYDHFLANTSEAADSIFFFAANRNNVAIQTEIRYEEEHNGTVLASTSFSTNVANIPKDGQARRSADSYSFTGLSGVPVHIKRTYQIRESGRLNPVIFQGNDQLVTEQIFERYYAYDDGTAESGFGFNDLRKSEGQVVVKFDMAKDDTLRAVAMNLTYNIDDVAKQRFDLQIWRSIAINGGIDDLVYSRTIVADSLHTVSQQNGFKLLEIDPIFLTAGTFYIGWSQNQDFNMGVGFDKNNGYLPEGRQMNTNIYFNIGDGWIQNSNKELIGAPMIRAVVGQAEPWSTSVAHPEQTKLHVYPNPVVDQLHIPDAVTSFNILNLNGQIVLSGGPENAIDVSELTGGIYIIQWVGNRGYTHASRFVKTN